MNKSKNVLTINWQRLVSKDNATCPRCGSTEEELNRAFIELKKKLEPSGIKVTLIKTTLSLDEFKKNPIESNRILFNGRSLESLLSAKTGSSQCCDVCEDNECRTLELNGNAHEIVTTDIIIKAGLKAISNFNKNLQNHLKGTGPFTLKIY